MAAITDVLSNTHNKVLQDGTPLVIEFASDAGGDIQPGAAVEPGATTPETLVGLAATGCLVGVGVCSDIGRLAIDSVIAAGEVAHIYLFGSSAIVAAFLEFGTAQTTVGLRMIAGGTTAGTFDIAGVLTAVDSRTTYGRSADFILQIANENKAFNFNLSI